MIVKIKPAIYSKKSTPLESREYNIVGDGSGAVGTMFEIRDYAIKRYGLPVTIMGKTVEGVEFKEELK